MYVEVHDKLERNFLRDGGRKYKMGVLLRRPE